MMRALVSAFASALLLTPSVSFAGFELGNGDGLLGAWAAYVPAFNIVGINRNGGTTAPPTQAPPSVLVGRPMLVDEIRSLFELRLQANNEPGEPFTEIESRLVEFQGLERLARGRDGTNRLETKMFWPTGGFVEATVVGCRQCRTPQAYQELQTALADHLRAYSMRQ